MKTFVIKLKLTRALVLAAGAAVLSATVLAVSLKTAAAEKLYPIYGVNTQKPFVSLTFDCAWEDTDLDEICAVLKQNSVTATFFVTGEFAKSYPDKLKKLKSSGHELGNHSNSHPHIKTLSKEALIEDTRGCSEAIKSATGEYPSLYRAPYGEYDNKTLKALSELSLDVIQWDCDSIDWKPDATVESIEENVSRRLQNGSILLFHVDAKSKITAEALKSILPKIKQSGYEFKRVSEIIPEKPYTFDSSGRITKTDA